MTQLLQLGDILLRVLSGRESVCSITRVLRGTRSFDYR